MKVAATSEFAARRQRVAAGLSARKLDALIVSAPANVRYLSGYTGSNGLLLLAPERAVLFTDPRYSIQARAESDCPVKVVRGPLHPALMQTAARRRLRRLGFERSRISYDAWAVLRDGLPLGATLTGIAGMVEAERMVKSRAEIDLIRRSVLANSKAYENAMRRVRPGITEAELAAEIEHQMRRLGAQKPAFDTIVASGPRTALPHARPTANELRRNQLLLIDMGASLDGYSSDMTRTAFLGRPGRKVSSLYRSVLEAQQAALDAVRPGIPASGVDAAARRVLRARGLERAFVHSTGHGLGLEIHEPPRLGKREATPLAAGMVITIEPGAYVEDFGGVRIEDTVVVTPGGCEVLTPTSKEFLVL